MKIEDESIALCPHIERDKLVLRLHEERKRNVDRANFQDCILRLSELGSSIPQITKAMRAAYLVKKEPRLTFEQAYAYVNHVDKYDRPEKGQPISD